MRTRFTFYSLVAAALAAAACQGRDATSEPLVSSDRTSPAPGDDTGPSNAVSPGSIDAGSGPAAPATSTPPGPPPPPFELTNETIDVGGVQRSFVLSKPTSYAAATPIPLVLSLHGDGGDGPSMQAGQPFEGSSGQAAIVVYPSGTNQAWNLYAPAEQNADVAFLTALVDAMRARFTIDASRVFATGISSGGFMVNQLACRRSTLLRAIAPQSGGAPSEPNDPTATTWGKGYDRCAGQNSGVAALVIHGKLDEMVPYESGNNTANYWSHVNGCAGTRTATTPAPCLQQSGCPADKPVVFCPIENLGHGMWNEAAKTAWDFFRGL